MSKPRPKRDKPQPLGWCITGHHADCKTASQNRFCSCDCHANGVSQD